LIQHHVGLSYALLIFLPFYRIAFSYQQSLRRCDAGVVGFGDEMDNEEKQV